MHSTNLRTARFLSITIAILASIAAAGGLILDGLYRDNLFVTSAWKGNDFVTLFIAVPLLIAALIFEKRGSRKAQLVWMGILDYMLYNFAFYLFGAAFNGFFLLYCALLGLSIFALIFGLTNIDLESVQRLARGARFRGWVASYMLLVAIGLTTIYLVQSFGFIFTDEIPAIVKRTGHPTSIVFGLDLTLLIPFLGLGAVWLLQRKAWGFVLAGISIVKGTLYTIVLTCGSFFAAQAGLEGVSNEIPLWIGLTLLGFAASGFFYLGEKWKQK